MIFLLIIQPSSHPIALTLPQHSLRLQISICNEDARQMAKTISGFCSGRLVEKPATAKSGLKPTLVML